MIGQIKNMDNYRQQYTQSIEDKNHYWENIASNLHWFQPWTDVQTGSFKELNIKNGLTGENKLKLQLPRPPPQNKWR